MSAQSLRRTGICSVTGPRFDLKLRSHTIKICQILKTRTPLGRRHLILNHLRKSYDQQCFQHRFPFLITKDLMQTSFQRLVSCAGQIIASLSHASQFHCKPQAKTSEWVPAHNQDADRAFNVLNSRGDPNRKPSTKLGQSGLN